MDKRTLYNIKYVAQSVLTKGNVTDDNKTKRVDIEQIVRVHDPFLCITPSVTKALFSDELSHSDLQQIVNRSYFSSSLLSLSHMSIKEHCSQLSVFAGRNPLDLAYPPLNEHDIESISEQLLLEMSERLDEIPNLDSKPQSHVLLEFLSPVSSKWYEICGLLGVDDNTLDGLHATNDSPQVKLSKTLQNWFNNQPTPTTWRKIIKIVEGPLQKKSVADVIRLI